MDFKSTERNSDTEMVDWSPDKLREDWLANSQQNEAAALFNSAIAASAISAVFEIGLFDEIEKFGEVRIVEFNNKRGAHLQSIRALLYALECFEIVEVNRDKDMVKAGRIFPDVFKNKGYFLWLIGGYGNMLQSLGQFSTNRNGETLPRDGRRIVLAGRDYGANFVDSFFMKMLDEEPYDVIADLGCGSAERLINLAKNRSDLRCIGVEVNEDAVKLARDSVAAANLQAQIQIIQADVGKLTAQEEFADVDVLFCFFMGHDLWPRENCIESLQHIRAAFPNAGRFLLSDTYRSDLPASRDVPIFTLGFELTHAVMGQYIPSVKEWVDLFTESGWNCVARKDLDIPYSSIFDLR